MRHERCTTIKNDLPFVHLHVHSNFSFLDGASHVEQLVARAAELGQPALALTDHDGLYGAVRFAKACAKHGIKPIFGAEVRVESLLEPAASPDGSPDGAPLSSASAPSDPHHLVLLAQDRQGYANLCRLISAAHLADPSRQRPPLVTFESLRAHAEGLLCLTGCRHGEVGYLVDAGRLDDARRALLRLRDIFPPDLAGQPRLYVELQYFAHEPQPVSGSACPSPSPLHSYNHACFVASPQAPHRGPQPESAHLRATTHTLTIPPAESFSSLRSSALPSSPSTPQHLNPADFDIGFHRDGTPWRLSCFTYCLLLAQLARVCDLPIVLTTNAHYAGEYDLDLHLVCRAAGRDQPLSDYPPVAPGRRYLYSKVRLETFAAPLLEALQGIGRSTADTEDDLADPSLERGETTTRLGRGRDCSYMQRYQYATNVAHRSQDQVAPVPLDFAPLAATAEIAERCHVDLELGVFHFPRVELPPGETAYSLLAKRCFRGIAHRYRPVPPRAVELLEKELRMIQEMGFGHYFLVVHDIVRWARARGIACSGRGSAGNSLVCYALGITASDPIRHHLLFERFLNPNRREMPDIDVDFCSVRRDEVIEHIYRTFGRENVAVVANVNTMSPRSAVRIVAEALGFAPSEINALAKNVPRHGEAARIREYLAGAWPELRDSPLQDSARPSVAPDGTVIPGGRYWRLLDLVERLDSFPLHLGTHLGGFVIADRPITHYTPLQWAAKGVVVTQFNKDDIAALGLVKMDILGLRTHSAVSECVHIIRHRTGRKIRPYDLPRDDPAAYEIISNGGSIGLFQLESPGQRNLATRLKERTFDDIIAAIALYRPGPLEAEMITPFVNRRWGLEPVNLPHPAMAEAVADTYGVILYQEQVLRIARDVAGFDLADADSLRRAMTRDRSREEMAKIGETFVSRAMARGVPEEAAREVFRQLEGFAAYGFNKSHSVCFAVISYATAWLKAHYPAEFLCAVLNNQPMGFYTPRAVLNDARRFGLHVRPLDINLSGRGFTVEDEVPPDPWSEPGYDPFAQAWTGERGWGLTEADLAELATEKETQAANPFPSGPGGAGAPATSLAPDAGRALRVGFKYLKHMSERALARIEEERRHGPFASFEDFYLRTRVEYPVAENLIRVGAFDSLEPDRTELLWRLPLLHDRLETLAGSAGARRGQLRAFSSPPSRAGLARSWTLKDKVRTELELLGLSVSCHPLQLYEEELRRLGVRMSYELPALGDEVPVTVAGVYERAQNPWMRSGKRTMFLTLEDAYGLFECVCFESKLPQIAPVVARASYFLVRGRLQNNHKRGLAIVAEEVFDLEEVLGRRTARRAAGLTSQAGATSGAAAAAPRPRRGNGRRRAGHPEAIEGRAGIPKKVG